MNLNECLKEYYGQEYPELPLVIECHMKPHYAGFGMWQAGESGSEIWDVDYLDEFLGFPEFEIAYDVDGAIYDQNGRVPLRFERDGETAILFLQVLDEEECELVDGEWKESADLAQI